MRKKKGWKHIFALLLSLALLLVTTPLNVVTVTASTSEFAGGDGTAENPYLIETKEQLDNVRNHLDAHYKMIADIVFTDADFAEGGDFYNDGLGWEPIATDGASFRGVFDGNNHAIQGLSINFIESHDKDFCCGLFGDVSNGKIQNLIMYKTSISVNNNHYIYAGCIVGYAYKSHISNCFAEGMITVENTNQSCALYAGGIVGEAISSSVIDAECNVNITSKGTDRIGGICGHISSGSILRATNHGMLLGTETVGGIVGESSNSTVEHSANYGALNSVLPTEAETGSADCGGIVGHANFEDNITLCANYGRVTSQSTEKYRSKAAGIAADGNNAIVISKCFNAGYIASSGSSETNSGGIVATYYFSSISDCYNMGEIVSTSNAGGVISFSQSSTVTNCYNIGNITATYAGGIVGENISSNFYNCVYLDNVFSASGKSTLTITQSTSEEMQKKITFENFDFDNTWEFAEGNAYLYPTLKINEYYLINENSDFQSGDGSEQSPYLIASAKHLNNIRNHLDANFKLVRDIVFFTSDFTESGNFYNNGQGWIPIGDSEDNAFCGVFDGNNFTIDNISNNIVYSTEGVTGSHRVYSTNIGLFGCNQGHIKNLEISNVEINVQLNSIKDNSVDGFIGIICGKNNGTISNCHVSGKINSVENYITEETLDTNVYSYVGGISGENNGIIQNCGSKALVIGCCAGGIVGGGNRVGSILDSCYNLGLVSGSDYASGICGGVNNGEISKCYNSGTIDGSRHVSGISSNNGASIENCFNSGALHGGSFVGGIVADWNSGNISCCYNVGDIYSTDYFGGIIFPSLNSKSGTVSNSYYLDNIPEEVGTGRKEGTRCSYKQMLEKDCFINFDFSTVWEVEIESDYEFPVLKNIRYSNINNSIYESADGTGKWWDPYKIRTKYDLDNIRNDLDAYYKLVGNIVFNKSDFDADGDFYNNGQGWIPIGTDNANSFSGEFDGAGFYIENLQINATLSDSAYIGLFGYSKGVIKNLGVINSNYSIKTFEANVYGGTIVGCTESDISNCYTNGRIEIVSTSSEADVIAVGGIAGLASNSKALSFYRCSNECNISIDRNVTSTATSGGLAQSFAGGIIGQAASIVSISECNNFGDILTSYTGNHLVDISSGGILGYSHGILAKINNCYNCGNVTAFSPDANNLVNNHAGGIAGDNHSIEVEQCYNSGNIRSNHESGGIFASTYAESSITDCFNVGNVSSGFSSGGIGGLTEATILNCYSVGLVEGRIYGGIVGFNNGGNATVTNCFYWDIVDRGVGNWDDNAIKCDLNAMKDLNTYNGFDFENVWSRSSNTNYAFPMLQSVNFVFEKELSIIKIDALPTKLQYLESKDLLDVSGGTIELFYNNGDISLLDMDVTMITGFDNTKIGKQTLTVTYSGKTTTFEVEITKKSLASISISKNPIKLEYLEGDTELDTTGMELILTYNNDSIETITGGWNTEYDFSTHGTKNVKVIYQGKEAFFSVTVLEKSISEISIASQPTKQEYVVGEDLQTAGLTIKITYNNGTSATVSTGWSITGYDKNKIGTQTITVTYQGKNATFTVTVKSKVPNSITSSTYIVSGGYISKILAGTTVNTLINGINEKQYIKVYKGNAEVSGNTKVGTGIIVKLMDGSTVKQSVTVVVTGDTNGDGDISITDMIAVKAQILGKSKFEDAVAKAADTNGDNGISITDFIQIKAHILGKSKIQAR